MGLSAVSVSLPTQAETLNVESNSSSGIDNASLTATRADGTVLGFYRSSSTVYFCGAVTSASSLSVPDSICYNSKNYAVKYFGGGDTIDFDEAGSVTELTLPNTVSSIRNYIPATVTNLNLNMENVPDLYNSGCIPQTTTVWVPVNSYSTFLSYSQNSSTIWYGLDIVYEGWTPAQYTINVDIAGSFANELLNPTLIVS